MDTVELARQFASKLHAAAVARGLDPWRPYDFVLGEALEHGFTVEDVLPGASILDGGRAKLLSSDGLILHERKGSPFEQALLVAHEIGHAKLGDGEETAPIEDIDFARSAERSQVGEERVVDYGRRQRREVQMDLFAREFLIPRSFIRKLHLEDGLTASDISTKLSAPFDVVAQQLLDALLLPSIEFSANNEDVEKRLNDEQREAAAHRGVAFLLEAGPGTGKTQTLIARVESLLDQGVDPRRILLLTFSNKAAGEMADRITLRRPEASVALWAGTFHAFGLDLIRRFHSELGFPQDPRMIDRTEAVELLEDEFPRLGLIHYQDIYDPTEVIYDILSAISRAKDEVVGPDEYRRLAQAMLDTASSPGEFEAAEKAIEVARVYAVYEELKRARNCVDFGDLVWLPVLLLESSAPIRSHLAASYDHVLVDEYQDVNRSSVRLLTCLCGEGNNLWVVGDSKQSIYRFRGASAFNVARFGKEDFPGGIARRLRLNYRSVKPIVDAYSAFAGMMSACRGVDTALDTNREDVGAAPEVLIAPSADEQTVTVADTIEALKSDGIPYRDQAVLCTGNDKLSEIAQDLERLGIPVLFLGSLFERPEIKDLLSFLSIIVDSRAMGLVRIACLPDFSMTLSDVASVLNYLRERETTPLAYLTKGAKIPGLSATGVEVLERLGVALIDFSTDDRPWRILATLLLDRTRIAANLCIEGRNLSQSRGIAIWQFMNFVRAQPTGPGLPISNLLNRVRRLLRLADDRDLRQLPDAAQTIDAVRLMTIHGAKGLEFVAVHVPGLNQDTLPGNRKPSPACPPPAGMIQGAAGTTEEILEASRREEQECLFYVAQSRARDRLFLYAASANRAKRARKLSEFLQRMGPGLTQRTVSPGRTLPAPAVPECVPLVFNGGLHLDAHQIELYERCPRRFFYTHVLRTGGKRQSTPFMNMHEAVRKVFKQVAAGDSYGGPANLSSKVAEALTEEGLGDNGHFNHYRDFAVAMINYFNSIRAGLTPETPTALRVAHGEDEVFITPCDVLLAPDGTRKLRRVRTGHGRKNDEKNFGAAAFMIAAAEAFPGAQVELVYLADQEIRPVDIKPATLGTQKEHIRKHIGGIREGLFPQNRSSRICPKCPAFFVCGPVPDGTLSPIFRVPDSEDSEGQS